MSDHADPPTFSREPYGIEDAKRDLEHTLGAAPANAVSGSWTATTLQAGTSSCQGRFLDAAGDGIADADDRWTQVYTAIGNARDKLEAGGSLPQWNTLTVHWSRTAGVTVTPSFDPATVPRAVDDPAYEQAAAARLRFWKTIGLVHPAYLAEDLEANIYNQTEWFGPHRRILAVRGPGVLLLATDGLSTPWAGIPDQENGVGCELCLQLTGPDRALAQDDPRLTLWAELLRNIGGAFADDNSLPDDIATNGPVLAFRLDADYLPHTRIVLSRHENPPGIPTDIPGLPFGPVRLIAVTPVTEDDLPGPEDQAEEPARIALARHAARTGRS